jgi:hypothetical protein
MGLDNPYYPVVELARYFRPYSRRYADFETSGVDKNFGQHPGKNLVSQPISPNVRDPDAAGIGPLKQASCAGAGRNFVQP